MLLIYLLTHNRPVQAVEAIESILAQSDSRFELIVSDNSDTDELRQLIGDKTRLTYIKRPIGLSGIEHGNFCLSEIEKTDGCQYFTLFHDDDLMLSNYVGNFWRAQALYPTAVAFGANAQVEQHKKFTELSFKAARDYLGPFNPNNLLRRYFSHHQLGIAPLPSYFYRRSALHGLRFDKAGGKYGDVQWLSRWAIRGPVIWIAEPMMIYRMHESNDGNIESRHDRFRFLAYLKRSGEIFSPEILGDYRNFFYKKLLPSLKDRGQMKAYQLFSQYLAVHRFQRLSRASFYRALLNKSWTKIYLRIHRKIGA
ncbi:glycosyltransferase family 2 protein [Polynucleobacter necessarius]|uniref:glycosyltransferase family 2 protein n=1 Tax=Polynucleobacter necessarius TaxID=576610 RepID=UPI0013B05F02|nr:glycosyltransferase [Polynucleobacter necessarius]